MKEADLRAQPIGILDSGFGGLTVMRALRTQLPHENILYFGDTARLPYGGKSAETITRYATECTSFLIQQGVKALVVACHSACSAAFDTLHQHFSIPIIGIVDEGVEEVVRLGEPKQVAIIGTRATISSGVYQHALQMSLPHAQIYALACPLFVPLVEEGYIEHEITALTVREYLRPLRDKNLDAILLGCTHYPLLETLIQKELGTQVRVIDPAASCAQKTQRVLAEKAMLNPNTTPPNYNFFVSDDPEKFRLLGPNYLNHPIEEVKLKL